MTKAFDRRLGEAIAPLPAAAGKLRILVILCSFLWVGWRLRGESVLISNDVLILFSVSLSLFRRRCIVGCLAGGNKCDH
jgi:hypothetical protein